MEKLNSRVFRKFLKDREKQVLVRKLNIEIKNICVFTVAGGNFTGKLKILKCFYALPDILRLCQERIDAI